MANPDLTASRLRELLNYDSNTGEFRWRASNGRRAVAGALAGSISSGGYQSIQLDGRKYKAHRLAWMHVHGSWPLQCIDHINGIKSDNKIANLRDVAQAMNVQNLRVAHQSNKNTGLLGVSKKSKCHKRYGAQIQMNRQRFCLGSFGSPEEAHEAYLEAKRRMHKGCTI